MVATLVVAALVLELAAGILLLATDDLALVALAAGLMAPAALLDLLSQAQGLAVLVPAAAWLCPAAAWLAARPLPAGAAHDLLRGRLPRIWLAPVAVAGGWLAVRASGLPLAGWDQVAAGLGLAALVLALSRGFLGTAPDTRRAAAALLCPAGMTLALLLNPHLDPGWLAPGFAVSALGALRVRLTLGAVRPGRPA
ncbi:MAG: hypothetical protein ACYDAY_02325 [Candidatus Dormibacteria bacterium]